jgi:hypothetical protein
MNFFSVACVISIQVWSRLDEFVKMFVNVVAANGALLILVRRTIPDADLYAAAAPTAEHTSSHHQYVTPAAAAARRRAALVAAAREAASRAV